MINALYKVVRNIIVPRYPWIKDITWTSRYYAGSQYYELELIVDKDFYLTNIENDSHIYNSLHNEIRMLFRAVGADKNVFFDDITFSPE